MGVSNYSCVLSYMLISHSVCVCVSVSQSVSIHIQWAMADKLLHMSQDKCTMHILGYNFIHRFSFQKEVFAQAPVSKKINISVVQ